MASKTGDVTHALPNFRSGIPSVFDIRPTVLGEDNQVDPTGTLREDAFRRKSTEGLVAVANDLNKGLRNVRYPTPSKDARYKTGGGPTRSTSLYSGVTGMATPEAAVGVNLLRVIKLLMRQFLSDSDAEEDLPTGPAAGGEGVLDVAVSDDDHSIIKAIEKVNAEVDAAYQTCYDLAKNVHASLDDIVTAFRSVATGGTRAAHLNIARQAAVLLELLKTHDPNHITTVLRCAGEGRTRKQANHDAAVLAGPWILANLCKDDAEDKAMLFNITKALQRSGQQSERLGHLVNALALLAPDLLVGKQASLYSQLQHDACDHWTTNETNRNDGKVPFDRDANQAHIIAIQGGANLVLALVECDTARYTTYVNVIQQISLAHPTFVTPMLPPDKNDPSSAETDYVVGSGEYGDDNETGFENPILQALIEHKRRQEKRRGFVNEDDCMQAFLETHNTVYMLKASLGGDKLPDTLMALVQRSGALSLTSPYGAQGSTIDYAWDDLLEHAEYSRQTLILDHTDDTKQQKPPNDAEQQITLKKAKGAASHAKKRSRKAPHVTAAGESQPRKTEEANIDNDAASDSDDASSDSGDAAGDKSDAAGDSDDAASDSGDATRDSGDAATDGGTSTAGMAPKTATSKAGQSGDTGLIKVANSHVDDKGASAKACANTAAAQNVPVTGNADAANEHAGGDAGTKTDDEPQATGPAPKRDAHVDDDAAAGNVDTKNGADPDVPTESVTKPKGDVTEPPAKPNTEAVVVQAGGSVVNFFDLTYGPNAEEPIENEVKICIDRMSSDTAFKKYSTIEKKAYMTTQKQNAVDKALLQGRFAFENELKKQVAKLTKDLNDQQILAERALTRRMSARLDGIDNDVCKAKKPRKRKHPDK